jgi:hypothetical protein
MATKTRTPEKEEQPPQILDLPIGIKATGKRKESDSLGRVEVPAEQFRTNTSLSLGLTFADAYGEGYPL